MYFHQPPSKDSAAKEQQTYAALSKDGLQFTPRQEELGHAYLRAFAYQGFTYGFGMAGTADGVFARSPDGLRPFEDGPRCLPKVRHSALFSKATRFSCSTRSWEKRPSGFSTRRST
jgi:hypothetical protein